jgi:DNA polymerase III, alpha subunit
MLEIFPENVYPRAVSNTVALSQRVENFSLFDYRSDLRPAPQIPANETEESYLRRTVTTLAYEQYQDDKSKLRQVLDRANTELEVLAAADYSGYMLIVTEYVSWFRESFSIRNSANEIVMSAVGVARGSAGGSVVAFLLGITDIDPIEHGLFFERFISAGRVDQAELSFGNSLVTAPVSNKVVVLTPDGIEAEKYIHQVHPGEWVLAEAGSMIGDLVSSVTVEEK